MINEKLSNEAHNPPLSKGDLSGLLPSKDEVVSELYSRVYNGEYKQRMVMRNAKQDCYYSGYLDCYDAIVALLCNNR